MPLSTNQYGYIIDPLVPLTDDTGRTISNGYVRVFMAGTSTPVITYKNFDGATNEETVQLDNSGRTAYPVIGSKGSTYKVCVYDAEHSQESPILTIDKVVPAGANVEATNIVTGLDNVESPEAGWVKSTVSGTDAEVSLDATNVTSEVDTMVKATAASADYMMPLVHKTGSDPDKKITLGNIFKFVLNFIHSLTDTATESDIASGSFFALDGSAGTKKLNSTTLLTKTAQNALAGNVAPAFDPTRDVDHPYLAGEQVIYNGQKKLFITSHYGAWVSADAVDFIDDYDIQFGRTVISLDTTQTSGYYNGKNVFFKIVPNSKLTISLENINVSFLPTNTYTKLIIRLRSKTGEILSTVGTYYRDSTIPNEININVPDNAYILEIFYRSSELANLFFEVVNPQKSCDEVAEKIDYTQLNSVGLSFVLTGIGNSEVLKFVDCEPNTSYSISVSPTNWAVTSLPTTSRTKLWIHSVDKDGNLTALREFTRDMSVPSKFFVLTPLSCKKLRIFYRGDVGDVVDFNVKNVSKEIFGEGCSVPGFGTTSQEIFIPCFANASYSFKLGNNDWPVTSISASSLKLIIGQKKTGGTVVNLFEVAKNTPAHNEYVFKTDSDCAFIRVFVRADVGYDFTCKIDSCETDELNQDDINAMDNKWRRGNELFQALILTDPHGTRLAYNWVKDFLIKNSSVIDAVFVNGDICPDHPTSSGAYSLFDEFVASSKVPVLPVIGNHDIGSSFYIGQHVSATKAAENVLGKAEEKEFIPSAPNGYYYKDNSDRKIRIVVLNGYGIAGTFDSESKWERIAYDSSAPLFAFGTSYSIGDIVNVDGWTDYSYKAKENFTSSASVPSTRDHTVPCWQSRPDWQGMDSAQADWFLNTLLSTPENYGVVVVLHSAYSGNSYWDETKKFCIKDGTTTASIISEGMLRTGSDFIADAIDAFVNGVQYTATISFDPDIEYNVSCDFSNKNAGVKFIGILGGHFHRDAVITHSTYSYQHQVLPSAAVVGYAKTDIRINQIPIYVPSLTLVSFDVVNGKMNAVKVGAKLTDDGYLRDCERL